MFYYDFFNIIENMNQLYRKSKKSYLLEINKSPWETQNDE